MKVEGKIEITGYDQVVVNRQQIFELNNGLWYNTKNVRHQISRPKMAYNIKRYIAMPHIYKVWVSGNTINIIKRCYL